jgi:RHS repeat-associated protein
MIAFVKISLVNISSNTVYLDEWLIKSVGIGIIQETHYEPLGTELYGLQKTSNSYHNYLYQGKEYEADNELFTYDFHARQYDAQLGRWHATDPARQFANPYLAMGNNWVVSVDPDGEWVHILVGAVIGGAINLAVNFDAAQGNGWKMLGYFYVGAAAGAIGAATFNPQASTVIAAIGSGALSGGLSGAVQSIGNAALGGRSFKETMIEGLIGGATGAISGAIFAGIGKGIELYRAKQALARTKALVAESQARADKLIPKGQLPKGQVEQLARPELKEFAYEGMEFLDDAGRIGGDMNIINNAAFEKTVGANAKEITVKWIKHDVYNELKNMNLADRFTKAMNKGFANTRFDDNGIIRLFGDEIKEHGGHLYSYKIKVLGKGVSHYRLYGRMDDNGALIFDYLIKSPK